MHPAPLDETVRVHAPIVLGALVRRYGSFSDCEDAVQHALIAASEQWPRDGMPDDPRAWLMTVARRRYIDILRAGRARDDRERANARLDEKVSGDAHVEVDDTLSLLLLCAHPVLPAASKVALTLRAVAGLTTAQIAAVFYVPEKTMGQRITRAKAMLRSAAARFDIDDVDEIDAIDDDRLIAVHQVLYLIFSEGHTASSGDRLLDVSLADEAIRLTRLLSTQLDRSAETEGLLALMLLMHARRRARTDAGGDLIPLADQDRRLWDRAELAEGLRRAEESLRRGPVGPFQLQAAIAAVHAEAAAWDDTDWRQILVLYRMLDFVAPSRTVTLNLAVALAMAHSPRDGLAIVSGLLDDPQMQRNHRAWAVHAHLLDQIGEPASAAASFRRAASMTLSIPEQRFLLAQAQRCSPDP